MKTLIFALTLAATGASTASAQIYQPAVVNGAFLGGIAGAIIGGHNNDRWGEGAIIGAAAGALLGAAVQAPRSVAYEQPPVTVVQGVATVPNAVVVPNPPAFPAAGAPQVVYVQQPAQVVYVPYYATAPAVVYETRPVFSIGVGRTWGPPRGYYGGHRYRHW